MDLYVTDRLARRLRTVMVAMAALTLATAPPAANPGQALAAPAAGCYSGSATAYDLFFFSDGTTLYVLVQATTGQTRWTTWAEYQAATGTADMSLQTTACRVGFYVALGQNLYFDGRGAWLVQTEGGWVNLDDLVNQTGDQAQDQDRPPADSEEPDLLDLKFDAWRLCVNNHMNSVWLGGTGGVPLHVACPMPSI